MTHASLWPAERVTTLLAFYNRDDGLMPAVAARLLVMEPEALDTELGFLRREGCLTQLGDDRRHRMTDAGIAALRASGRLVSATAVDYQGNVMRPSLEADTAVCSCGEGITRFSAHMGLYWAHDSGGLHDHDASPA
jgi:hypothetical protein